MSRRDPTGPDDLPAHLPLRHLTALWFQVTGLLCNLECTHCLVDSSPTNTSMPFLDRETIRRYLAEAEALGVKEIYFTGGEPFLHREMPEILEDALAVAPATVLTNGTLITERLARRLGEIFRAARYSLEVRVSLDHPDAERNDAVRGQSAHAKALRAVTRLTEAGLLPIVTATEYLLAPRSGGEEGMYESFRRVLAAAGVQKPRLKVLPVFHTGKLDDAAHGGPITAGMLRQVDGLLLQCATSRAVTARGVYACPILVGQETALVGRDSLGGSADEVVLSHHACRTCYETGMTCRNF